MCRNGSETQEEAPIFPNIKKATYFIVSPGQTWGLYYEARSTNSGYLVIIWLHLTSLGSLSLSDPTTLVINSVSQPRVSQSSHERVHIKGVESASDQTWTSLLAAERHILWTKSKLYNMRQIGQRETHNPAKSNTAAKCSKTSATVWLWKLTGF